MANDAGLDVCEYDLTEVAGKQIYLTKRFDRVNGHVNGQSIPFTSAMALSDYEDGYYDFSYLELVDILTEAGASPEQDIKQLFMRMTFSVLISNVDDHFRNHGFLWENNKGWRLGPMYDVNPVYNSNGSLRSCIDYDNSTASVSLLLEVAGYFGLDKKTAKQEIKKIADVVTHWRKYATQRNAPRKEMELMARAFEHDELNMALNF